MPVDKFKTCKQCGVTKPIAQFRPYYGQRKGTYTMCLDCESVNSREKYLTKKAENRSAEESDELNGIYATWEDQREQGLTPPRTVTMRRAAADRRSAPGQGRHAGAPLQHPDLTHWLTVLLDMEPEYYLDEIYEHLSDKYRPILYIDNATMLPVYDDTYESVLLKILERFNDYEDVYYSKTQL